MESEYENFLRNMRIESVAMIREADANPDKWYELFVAEGEDIGTHTVESGDTFSEVVERFGDCADEYGLNNLHIDIWENRANPRPVAGIPLPSDKPNLIFVSFRIDSGYKSGVGMSREISVAFYSEITHLFEGAGYDIETTSSASRYFLRGRTRLYCHPQELTGVCEKADIPAVKSILSMGTTFRHYHTDLYDEVFDYDREQELEYYRLTHTSEVEETLLRAFSTDLRNIYRPKVEIVQAVADTISIKTMLHPVIGHSDADPSYMFVNEVYNRLLSEGRLIERCKMLGVCRIEFCRTATVLARNKSTKSE